MKNKLCIQRHKSNKNSVILFFEEFDIKIPKHLFKKEKLILNRCFSSSKLNELRNESEEYYCYEKAIKILKYQRTESELRTKLNGFRPQIIEKIIEKVIKKNYINDLSYMNNLRRIKPNFSSKRLEIFFKSKGINEELIKEFLDNIDDGEALKNKYLKILLKTKVSSQSYMKRDILKKLIQEGFDYNKSYTFINENFKYEFDENEVLKDFYYKTYFKIKGDFKIKSKRWISKAVQKGFKLQDAKKICEDLEHEDIN